MDLQFKNFYEKFDEWNNQESKLCCNYVIKITKLEK